MIDKTAYPPRIWLLPDSGDDGQTTWCDDPAPMDGMDKDDAIEYVRADLAMRWETADKRPPNGLTVPVINGGRVTTGRHYAGFCWESEGGDELSDVTHWIMPISP